MTVAHAIKLVEAGTKSKRKKVRTRLPVALCSASSALPKEPCPSTFFCLYASITRAAKPEIVLFSSCVSIEVFVGVGVGVGWKSYFFCVLKKLRIFFEVTTRRVFATRVLPGDPRVCDQLASRPAGIPNTGVSESWQYSLSIKYSCCFCDTSLKTNKQYTTHDAERSTGDFAHTEQDSGSRLRAHTILNVCECSFVS